MKILCPTYQHSSNKAPKTEKTILVCSCFKEFPLVPAEIFPFEKGSRLVARKLVSL